MADRVGASYAERAIGDRVAQQVTEQKATSEKPDVTIEGVPFLTQVLAGEYQEIKILLNNFTGPAGNGKNDQDAAARHPGQGRRRAAGHASAPATATSSPARSPAPARSTTPTWPT